MNIHHPLSTVRHILAALLGIIATTAAAHARIGETPEQCVARYGQPIKSDPASPGPGTIWLFRGVYIAASFLPDSQGQLRVTGISYVREDPDTGATLDFSPAEISAFLHINGASDWPETAGGIPPYSWTAPDGSTARYIGQMIIICTKAQLDAYERTPQQALETTLSGF